MRGHVLITWYFNFNPRSHERSDMRGHVLITWYFNFNPRSHERSDGEHVRDRRGEISIHAPTRGATHTTGNNVNLYAFQSTLPREERLMMNLSLNQWQNFNPRSHERSDRYHTVQQCGRLLISIHAPTRGATILRY